MVETLLKQNLDSLPEARAIREEVFIREQGFEREYDDTDKTAWHVLIKADGIPVATGRTFPSPYGQGLYAIGRVAVLKPYRGRDFGRTVMTALEKKARELGAKGCVLSAQVRAKGFYERIGYVSEGEVYLDEGQPHVRMTKMF